ncbi:MAG: bifunctional DNA-formamidopyrimidine glycosylase/DNA-(apurinic or apyrimidinic site) lyase [Alphaproteobacteria bacterium]
MPELPEVETVRRGLAPVLEGRCLRRVEQRRKDLRVPFPENFAARLQGCRVDRLDRRGKYLLARLDDGNVWVIHLGMSGRMVIDPPAMADGAAAPGRHDHVIIETDQGRRIRFNDARRFGLMMLMPESEIASHPLFRDLGPEPLGNDFNGVTLAAALRGKKTPIKSALLDQHVVAGLGNIYVCESLYHAGIAPHRQAHRVAVAAKGALAENLARAIRQVLNDAIAAGGASLRDHVQPSGELGYFQHLFAVYGREGKPCPGCDCDVKRNGGIKRIVQSGRSTFYCAQRQRHNP